jgi:hypothetical protein
VGGIMMLAIGAGHHDDRDEHPERGRADRGADITSHHRSPASVVIPDKMRQGSALDARAMGTTQKLACASQR